ncbi:hypothetical protein J7T55_010613 [Diaporthe amygdali]|uniref:uncharacterized protein n=1 Tax=Phomopsis amygdali TaxID=1214568 RepID=UPI0022FEE3B8|nr:uncharacterized protein J7T55_010613 [Diaporthe amygdali]KAJ0115790.1 hypothetical protein J7T55_010613 [Diaporthe amygdali]
MAVDNGVAGGARRSPEFLHSENDIGEASNQDAATRRRQQPPLKAVNKPREWNIEILWYKSANGVVVGLSFSISTGTSVYGLEWNLSVTNYGVD